ncbi:unnamed protein product [Phytophthora fragariaefolia]|uniref:Unnamed protein product n=1 Tax=Phytophthora fragariaefolia TaxID=1490495 RepID=A0A9W6WSP6_9STRA|nr:unnamed protein product [Phytophthora fragariaefolia]
MDTYTKVGMGTRLACVPLSLPDWMKVGSQTPFTQSGIDLDLSGSQEDGWPPPPSQEAPERRVDERTSTGLTVGSSCNSDAAEDCTVSVTDSFGGVCDLIGEQVHTHSGESVKSPDSLNRTDHANVATEAGCDTAFRM